jgi:pyrimidine-nucleoside phosphorylase
MVYLADKASSLEEARRMLQEVIENGKALESFKTFLAAQGGDPSVVDDVAKLPQAAHKIEVNAEKDGYVSEIVADEVGTAAMWLGAGRATKDSEIDLAVGLMLRKKVGDEVKKGESLVTIYSNKEDVQEVKEHILKNISISSKKVEAPSLIYDTVQKSN